MQSQQGDILHAPNIVFSKMDVFSHQGSAHVSFIKAGHMVAGAAVSRHHLALLMWICQVCTHYVIHYFDFHFPPTVYTNSLNLKNVKFFSYHARQWKDFSLVPPQLFLTVMNKFLHLAKGGNTQCLFRLLWLCIVLVWPIHPPRSPLQARPGSGSSVCYMNRFLYEYASCLILETVWGLFPATSHGLLQLAWLSWRWEKKEYSFFFLSTDIIGWGEKRVKTMTCL